MSAPQNSTPITFVKTSKGPVEHRIDPLTGNETRINPARANRPKQGQDFDSGFADVIKKSQERCPFCPERIMEKVPKFEENICKDGRIKLNQTVIFPNLSPFGSNHAVGVMSDAHFVALDQYSVELLQDTLLASKQYMEAVYASDKKNQYPVFVWNYLPPSAGSIIHPHIQMLIEDEPIPALKNRINQSAEYFQKNKRNYFADLLATETTLKERYITGNNTAHAITTFAPRGFNEVEIIVPNISSFTQLNQQQIHDLADLLRKLLVAYKANGVGSFNLASFSNNFSASADDFWLHFKLFSRPFPNGVYTNDTGPMERMYDSWVIDSVPEKLAENLRTSLP